jgi:peptidoglycan L-alanyl-D-glutamate endopeptidase CwlK
MSLRKEIQRLQRRVGVKADGLVGPVTVAALHAAIDQEKAEPATENLLCSATSEFHVFDKRTEKNLETLRLSVQPKFRAFMAEAQAMAAVHGVDYFTISGRRSYAQQNALYAKGRTKPGPKVTNARGGYSNHNFGDALDNGVFKNGRYLDGSKKKAERDLALKIHRLAGDIAKKHGLEWGGDWKRFKDDPHFEFPGLTMAQKRAKVRSGEWAE